MIQYEDWKVFLFRVSHHLEEKANGDQPKEERIIEETPFEYPLNVRYSIQVNHQYHLSAKEAHSWRLPRTDCQEVTVISGHQSNCFSTGMRFVECRKDTGTRLLRRIHSSRWGMREKEKERVTVSVADSESNAWERLHMWRNIRDQRTRKSLQSVSNGIKSICNVPCVIRPANSENLVSWLNYAKLFPISMSPSHSVSLLSFRAVALFSSLSMPDRVRSIYRNPLSTVFLPAKRETQTFTRSFS